MAGQLYVGGLHGEPDVPQHHLPIVDDDGTMLALEAGTLLSLMTGTGIEARTVTADGTAGAVISATEKAVALVAVTSGNAAHMITLPAPTPGRIVILFVGANGFELKSSAPATVAIGGNTPSSAHTSAIPANCVAWLFCVDATHWVGFSITGATLAAVPTAD